MRTYIGVKIVQAEQCTLGVYNMRRGWTMPAGEDPSRPGYYLRYPDGYQSWSPAEIFEGAYRLVSDDERKLVLPDARDAERKSSFYDRLLAESRELETRRDKLKEFIDGLDFLSLPDEQQKLMRAQFVAMDNYAQILGQRIAAITRGTQGQQRAGEDIDENVRLTGGNHSEEAIPFVS